MAIAEGLARHLHTDALVCPMCEQEVTEDAWGKIRERVEAQDRIRADEVEALVARKVGETQAAADLRVADASRGADLQVAETRGTRQAVSS